MYFFIKNDLDMVSVSSPVTRIIKLTIYKNYDLYAQKIEKFTKLKQ